MTKAAHARGRLSALPNSNAAMAANCETVAALPSRLARKSYRSQRRSAGTAA